MLRSPGNPPDRFIRALAHIGYFATLQGYELEMADLDGGNAAVAVVQTRDVTLGVQSRPGGIGPAVWGCLEEHSYKLKWGDSFEFWH